MKNSREFYCLQLGNHSSSSGSGGLRSRRSALTVVGEYVDLQEKKDSTSNNNRQEKDTGQDDKDASSNVRQLRVLVEVEENPERGKET